MIVSGLGTPSFKELEVRFAFFFLTFSLLPKDTLGVVVQEEINNIGVSIITVIFTECGCLKI